MNWLDLAVIGVVLLSAVFAFARGFVREALSIIAWVGAAAVTLYGFNWVYALVDPRVHNPLLSQVIAGFGLFVGSLLVLTILTGLVARTVRSSGLSPIDRTLGFVFGAARGVLLLCVAYLALDMMLPQLNDRPAWVNEAKSARYLHEGADALSGFLPQNWKQKIATAGDDAFRTIDPKAAAAADAAKAAGALANPTPTPAPTAQPPAPDYKPAERRQMDRAFENNAR